MDDLTKERAYQMLMETAGGDPVVMGLMGLYFDLTQNGQQPNVIMNAMLNMSMGFFVNSAPEHADELFALLREMHFSRRAIALGPGVTAKEVHDSYVETDYIEKQRELFRRMYPVPDQEDSGK
jgi:hypothetical protein